LTLPAKKLFEIINALPDTDVRLEADKGGRSVTVAADRFESKLQTLPASEFPTPPQDAGTTESSLPGAALKRMISHTRFAITSEDTRYFLNGAQLVIAARLV
jgi:DNA polymerase-3 subunit beta